MPYISHSRSLGFSGTGAGPSFGSTNSPVTGSCWAWMRAISSSRVATSGTEPNAAGDLARRRSAVADPSRRRGGRRRCGRRRRPPRRPPARRATARPRRCRTGQRRARAAVADTEAAPSLPWPDRAVPSRRSRSTRAGTPATTDHGGTSRVTTAPAAITLCGTDGHPVDDGDVGADPHVVLDDHALRREPLPGDRHVEVVEHVVLPDEHGVGGDAHEVADRDLADRGRAGVERAVLADLDLAPDHAARRRWWCAHRPAAARRRRGLRGRSRSEGAGRSPGVRSAPRSETRTTAVGADPYDSSHGSKDLRSSSTPSHRAWGSGSSSSGIRPGCPARLPCAADPTGIRLDRSANAPAPVWSCIGAPGRGPRR